MSQSRHVNHGLCKRCDCPRRTWPKCRHSWWFNFQPKGGPSFRISLDKHAGKHVDRKADAEDAAANLRTAIVNGTFGTDRPVVASLTLRQLLELYDRRYLQVERPASGARLKCQIGKIVSTLVPFPTGGTTPFGEWSVVDLTTDAIEQFRAIRRPAGVSTSNRDLALLRAMFSWAIRGGYLESTPFKRHGEAVIKFAKELPRSRRLQGDEADRLLAACRHLRGIVECALESGMRKGEILSLQWSQVEGLTVIGPTTTWAPRSQIVVTAIKAKTRTERRIPISTRLKAILESRRLDPTGQPHPSTAFVFGTSIGTRINGFKRPWNEAVLKAHGHAPAYTRNGNLTLASRAPLAAIGLHFHDLRREAGSRWMDGGIPIATIQRWLGHTNVAQTSTYLSGTPASEHDALRQYEERRANVQQCVTDVGKGGQKRLGAAEAGEETPNETAGDRQTTIM